MREAGEKQLVKQEGKASSRSRDGRQTDPESDRWPRTLWAEIARSWGGGCSAERGREAAGGHSSTRGTEGFSLLGALSSRCPHAQPRQPRLGLGLQRSQPSPRWGPGLLPALQPRTCRAAPPRSGARWWESTLGPRATPSPARGGTTCCRWSLSPGPALGQTPGNQTQGTGDA